MPVTPESNAANRISLHRFSMINGGSAAAGSPRGGLAPSCAHDVTSNRAPKPRGLVGRITPKPPDQWPGSLAVLTLLAIVAPGSSSLSSRRSSLLWSLSYRLRYRRSRIVFAIVAPIVSGIVAPIVFAIVALVSSLLRTVFPVSSARLVSHGGPTGSFNRGQRSNSPGTNPPQASIKISEVSVRFFRSPLFHLGSFGQTA